MRRSNSHQWIKNDSDEDDILESKDSEKTVNRDGVKRWQDGICQ